MSRLKRILRNGLAAAVALAPPACAASPPVADPPDMGRPPADLVIRDVRLWLDDEARR